MGLGVALTQEERSHLLDLINSPGWWVLLKLVGLRLQSDYSVLEASTNQVELFRKQGEVQEKKWLMHFGEALTAQEPQPRGHY